MSKMFATKALTAILSIVTIGAALSFGAGTARAGDNNVTEDEIVRALTPEKKPPLTRACRLARKPDPLRVPPKASS